MKKDALIKYGRKEFIIKTFSSCVLCYFGIPNLHGYERKPYTFISDDQHKFLQDSKLSIQEVYNFAFRNNYIPAMKNLMEQLGKERFLKLLRKSSDMLSSNDKDAVINYSERTFNNWSNYIKKISKEWNDRITVEILTDNPDFLEAKVRECLWAKTFREADASDIGYAGICYGDYVEARQFNPKLKLIRESTLMQGHDCCHFKLVMES